MRALFFLLLSAFFIFLAFPARAGLEEGVKAYQEGNWLAAVEHLRPLAEQDNPRALLLLGNMYMDGKGFEKNAETAFRHYLRAADLGEADAMVSVAAMYSGGVVVEKNPQKAFEWFRRSAEAGSPGGQVFLGLSYLSGQGVEKSEKDAYTWLRIAGANSPSEKAAKVARDLYGPLAENLSAQDLADAEEAARKFIEERGGAASQKDQADPSAPADGDAAEPGTSTQSVPAVP